MIHLLECSSGMVTLSTLAMIGPSQLWTTKVFNGDISLTKERAFFTFLEFKKKGAAYILRL